MNFTEISVESAGMDFVENVWPTLFPGKRGSRNREYMKVRAFVIQAKKPEGASKGWTVKILKEYGGGKYSITERIEIEAAQGNGKRFTELAAEFREQNPDFGVGWDEENEETKNS